MVTVGFIVHVSVGFGVQVSVGFVVGVGVGVVIVMYSFRVFCIASVVSFLIKLVVKFTNQPPIYPNRFLEHSGLFKTLFFESSKKITDNSSESSPNDYFNY
jgi:hypothetical protein